MSFWFILYTQSFSFEIEYNQSMTLNLRKTNYVIFRPHQKKQNYQVSVKLFDNSTNNSIEFECKEFVKYLGVLIDSNLTWKYHTDNISSKISKAIGIIARLRHFVPVSTLHNISLFNITIYNLWLNCMGACVKKLCQSDTYFTKTGITINLF